MPLQNIFSQIGLSQEEMDAIESAFNLSSRPNESDEQRVKRATDIVDLFLAGKKERSRLVAALATGKMTSAKETSPVAGTTKPASET